ncbi:hypothetical protein Hdeb2414_s0733g00940901 [Helianthus debilis subsp. tardiflorus]
MTISATGKLILCNCRPVLGSFTQDQWIIHARPIVFMLRVRVMR